MVAQHPYAIDDFRLNSKIDKILYRFRREQNDSGRNVMRDEKAGTQIRYMNLNKTAI